MDEVIFEEFKGAGNSELILDRKVSGKNSLSSSSAHIAVRSALLIYDRISGYGGRRSAAKSLIQREKKPWTADSANTRRKRSCGLQGGRQSLTQLVHRRLWFCPDCLCDILANLKVFWMGVVISRELLFETGRADVSVRCEWQREKYRRRA
jgi:hypothetical protein